MWMSKPGESSLEEKPLLTAAARSSATCCTVIATSSKVSIKSSRMRRYVSTSKPIASCSCLFPEFVASRTVASRSKDKYTQKRRPSSKEKHPRRSDVHTPQPGSCTLHDDYERHLLGLLGQYLQGRQELSLRVVLLGLRHRHFPGVADPRAYHGQHGQ